MSEILRIKKSHVIYARAIATLWVFFVPMVLVVTLLAERGYLPDAALIIKAATAIMVCACILLGGGLLLLGIMCIRSLDRKPFFSRPTLLIFDVMVTIGGIIILVLALLLCAASFGWVS